MSDTEPPPAPAAQPEAEPQTEPDAPEEPTPSGPRPVQIVSSNEDGNEFEFHEELLDEIFAKIPSNMKVSVVSVVGAFRTGKSFLLSFFLRYLTHTATHDGAEDGWLDFDKLSGASGADDVDLSFSWRGGQERNTTGIWVWSEPFIRDLPDGEPIALLLIDTQGLFDNSTTMELTKSIFGLSALLSSYQIYNVSRLIQEDNLQYLALFTEYAKVASENERRRGEEEKEGSGEGGRPESRTPFQHLEFLVRDWENADDETDVPAMTAEAEEYLTGVLSERAQEGLSYTRDQINSCYQSISCWLLPHPGLQVPKKSYDGSVGKIRDEFKLLLDVFVRRVFNDALTPKTVQERVVTAGELQTYFKGYVRLFADGNGIFPEAVTVLQATVMANNQNATQGAVDAYETAMDRHAGASARYCKDLEDHHHRHKAAAERIFWQLATMGTDTEIEACFGKVQDQINRAWAKYAATNDGRNPFKIFELYLWPLIMACAAFVLRVVLDVLCVGWSDVCDDASHMLSHVYVAIFTFFVILGAMYGAAAYGYLQQSPLTATIMGAATGAGKAKRD